MMQSAKAADSATAAIATQQQQQQQQPQIQSECSIQHNNANDSIIPNTHNSLSGSCTHEDGHSKRINGSSDDYGDKISAADDKEESGSLKGSWEDQSPDSSEPVCLSPPVPCAPANSIPTPNSATPTASCEVEDEVTSDGAPKRPGGQLGGAGGAAKLAEPDARPHLNIVFIGHVDAGKSTTCGNILYMTGQVDKRTIEKYEREAKDKNRETWFLAFIMDINEEERAKGKTVEVGRALFDLPNKRFTILDAPGHKSFVPNMISGAAQADVAVLIVSARKGEFETGFERGGQTREHAMLAKTLGVNQIVVAVNKMDDRTCQWSEDRYRDIEKKLTPFLRSCGYNPARDVVFIPMSGLTGQNILDPVGDPSSSKYVEAAKWWGPDKPTLLGLLDSLQPPERSPNDALRIPLLEGFKDQGVMAVGKVEAGTITANQNVIVMPSRTKVKVAGVVVNEEEVACAKPGENVTLRLMGVDEDCISRGDVMCCVEDPCPAVTKFKAQIMIVELLEHRPILTAGYSCVLHAHTANDDVQFLELLEATDKVKKKKQSKPTFVKGNSMLTCILQLQNPICLEAFSTRPQLGRFTLRDEGVTIGIGKVLEIVE